MSRLPDLERALHDAAARLDARSTDQPSPSPERATVARWRRRGTPLLVGLVSLAVAGGAVAAATGLLERGDPVPVSAGVSGLKPVPGTKGFALASIRVPDPEGGPPWGIGLYDAVGTTAPKGVPDDIAAQFRRPTTCAVVGRVQDDQLGVVGRDGVFANDARFHALAPAAQASSQCGGGREDGTFFTIGFGPPIPASGYTGPVGTAIGGCRERVNLNGPTVSPQTRRKLKGVPECAVAGLRRVIFGFAGPQAATATLATGAAQRTERLHADQSGAYLFVVRSSSTRPPRLTITLRNGEVCQPFAAPARTPAGTPSAGSVNCSELGTRSSAGP